MRYLLDTNIFTYTSLKDAHQRFLSDSGNILHRMLQSSTITLFELQYGVEKANTGNVPRMPLPNSFCH